MPTINAGFNDTFGLVRFGPTVSVQIGYDPAFKVGVRPDLPETILPALVDTGATESCIDTDLAKKLNLPLVDRGELSGSQGSHTADIYLAQIHVIDLAFSVYGRFAGVHLAAGNQPHAALLGRTFLRNFKMIYEGRTGEVTITRRTGEEQ